jgi:PBP1b-binding outer membrane lipoprotein LpoB
MKQLLAILVLMFAITSCSRELENTSTLEEQKKTEANQRDLNAIQPAPKISWSLERDNLIKRFKLQNENHFFLYVCVRRRCG